MSDDDIKELSNSITKLKLMCKVIQMVCLVCLIGFVTLWLLISGLQVFEIINGVQNGINIGDVLYQILVGIMVCILLIVTLRVFSDIVAGETPFTMKQVRRLRIAGTVLIAFSLIDTLISASFYFITDIAGQYSGVIASSGIDSSFIHIDLTSIIAALACYGLALIFKYGILLQELSDDTL